MGKHANEILVMRYFLKITKAYGSTSRALHPKSVLCAFALHSLAIALLTMVFAGPASATIIINAPMTDTNGTGWTMGGSPGATLTGNGTIDPVGNGWLRLTDNNGAGNETGFAYNNTSFDLSQGLLIEFDYATWGGSGADGYSVYLFDAGVSPFNLGAYGGSLGYAQKGTSASGGACSSTANVPGISGGYVGIGVDEFGNFADCGEGRYLELEQQQQCGPQYHIDPRSCSWFWRRRRRFNAEHIILSLGRHLSHSPQLTVVQRLAETVSDRRKLPPCAHPDQPGA